MVLNRTKLNKGIVMDMKELANHIVSDVRGNNPNATPEDVVARLENLGFVSEFASELVANYNNQ